MTHEATKLSEMEDYFTKKFAPILPHVYDRQELQVGSDLQAEVHIV